MKGKGKWGGWEVNFASKQLEFSPRDIIGARRKITYRISVAKLTCAMDVLDYAVHLAKTYDVEPCAGDFIRMMDELFQIRKRMQLVEETGGPADLELALETIERQMRADLAAKELAEEDTAPFKPRPNRSPNIQNIPRTASWPKAKR